MGSVEVNTFLTHLAVERRVSASTQNQALWQRRRLPVVLSEAEVRAVRRELEEIQPWWWDCCMGVDFACSQRLPRSGWRHCASECRIWISSGGS